MDDGTVNIRHGGSSSSNGNGGGFFSSGFGGGGSSRKRRARRIKARREAQRQQAEAVQRQQAEAAERQRVAEQLQHYLAARSAIDARQRILRHDLPQSIDRQIQSITRPGSLAFVGPISQPGLDRAKQDIQALDALIQEKATARAVLQSRATAFFGEEPSMASAERYLQRLQQLHYTQTAVSPLWHDAYQSAQSHQLMNEEIALLSAQRDQLELARVQAETQFHKHLEAMAKLRHRAEEARIARAAHEAQRQANFKRFHAFDEVRYQRAVTSLHRYPTPLAATPGQAQVLTRGGAISSAEAATALYQQITQAAEELARVAALRTGQVVGGFVGLMTYSPVLGDGELSTAQRQQMFDVVSIPLASLAPDRGLADGSTAQLPYRLSSESEGEHRNLYLVDAINSADSSVTVRDAVFDAKRNLWSVESPNVPATTISIAAQPVVAGTALQLALLERPTVHPLTADQSDFRFNDFIARFPAASGIAPLYMALGTPSKEYGVVTGSGQPIEIAPAALARTGAEHIPVAIADQLRWRSFDHLAAFESAVWKAAASQAMDWQLSSDLNVRRMQKGFAPLALREQWLGDRRTLEIHTSAPPSPGTGLYDLDALRMVPPSLANGRRRGRPQDIPVAPGSPLALEFANARTLAHAQREAARRQAVAQAHNLQQAEQARRQALARINDYSVPLTAWQAGMGFTDKGEINTSADAAQHLQASLLSAIAQTLADGEPVSALVVSLSYGSAEEAKYARFAFHAPLSLIAPDVHLDASTAPAERALPIRLGSVVVGNEVAILTTSTAVIGLEASVPIEYVAFDAATSTYHVTTNDGPPLTLTWTPATAPGSDALGPRELPVAPERIVTYSGGSSTALEAQIETLPMIDELEVDDYIFVFPLDSGIEPQYVMFQRRIGPRYEPGVATGLGGIVDEVWLGEATQTTGALVPRQIADKLRGQTFRDFDHFRKQFWKAVGADKQLHTQFNDENLHKMRETGNAPYTQSSYKISGRRTFELHHVIPIKEGGSVYDMDNLRLVTPKAHNAIHYGTKS